MDSSNRYEAIVVGVGAVGSAATYHLAKRGVDVLGIEQFDVPNRKGSSRGLTRVINPALRGNPEYVPMTQRAIELWEELQDAHDHKILEKTGAIRGWPSSDYEGYRGTLDEAVEACEIHDAPYEVLTASELEKRYPAYDLPDDYRFVWQPDGGLLDPEECVIAHMNETHEHGGVIRARERVEDWESTADGVSVRTEKNHYTADQLVITAGPWISKLLDFADGVTVSRSIVGWFRPTNAELFSADRFPAFSMDTEGGYFYGTPAHRIDGVKVGGSADLETTPVDPDTVDRTVTRDDERELRRFLEQFIPEAAGPTLKMVSCMVTKTADIQYLLGPHPEHPNVHIAGGFSGSGFTTASAVGEIVSDFVLDREPSFDLDRFDPARLSS
jgi:sarcosine oxidase